MPREKSVTTRIIDVSGFRNIVSYMSDTAEWLADTGESQRIFDKMLEDSRVGSLVELRKDQVLLLEGSFTDGGDKLVDKAVRENLGFNTLFNLNNILLNAIPFGLAAVEVLWSRKDGLLVPSGFVPIPMKALSFPGWGAMKDYMTPMLSGQQIYLDNPDKFLIHRNDSGNGDRWGTPVLKQVYWPWKFKTFGFDAWIFAAKKIGVPTILALFESKGEEESRQRARNLVDVLSQWEAGSNGAMGNVTDVKVISSSIQDFNTLIETCNAEIAYGITGQSLATNQAQYGTRAQSDTHVGVLKTVVTKDAYLLQQTNQQLVNAFCRLNFPGRPIPTYDIDSTDIADWTVVREAIDRGIPVSKAALYEKLRLPRPKDETDSFVKEQAEGFGFDDSFFFAETVGTEGKNAQKIESLVYKARQAIASSYAKRIRQVVEEELKNPGYLEKIKTLPHSKEATNVTALLFTKVLLMGMNHALGKKKKGHKFADGVDGEAADIRDVEVLPFEEAVEYMRARLPLDAKEYYKLADKARFRAFTVSLLADGDLLKKAKDMLAKNLEEGGGLKDFLVKTDTELLAGVGMAGAGSGWYWETVYRTNVQTAYNVGRAIGFEAVPPVALELVGIGDARQTELCKSLTQPPVRRLYGDDFWKKFWPPLHFNCRTTVRAIYDTQELEEQPITGIPADAEKHKSQGWGSYPLDSDKWWEELPSMKKRAQAYGVQGMIDRARERLLEKNKTQLITPESIEIPPAKLTEYALNPEHPVGKHKAKIFESVLGYTLDNYQDLIDNVYRNIDEAKFVPKGNQGHGMRYEQILELTGPNGNKAKVLTAWIETDTKGKRLTTIYVLPKESDT